MSARSKVGAHLAVWGHLFRVLVVASMLLAAIATLPSAASAKTSPISGIFAQGASWEAQPQSQRNRDKNDDDEDDEDDDAGSKNIKDDDEDDDSASNDDDVDDDSSSKDDDVDDDDDDDSSSGSSKNSKLPRDWTRNGVISETEYESPQYGYVVEWDEPWVIDDYYDTDDDDETATVISDEDTGRDEIRLWVPDVSGLLTVQFTPSNGSDATDVQDYWESDEYYEGFTDGGEYLASDGDEERAGVLFLIGDPEEGYIGYNEITMLDGGDTMLALYLRAPIADFLDVYGEGNDNVEVDGEEVFDILRSRDVRNAIRDL